MRVYSEQLEKLRKDKENLEKEIKEKEEKAKEKMKVDKEVMMSQSSSQRTILPLVKEHIS